MNVSHLIIDLNQKQKEAVLSQAKNLLVLAGAGSGKTRVLVYRIARLISEKNNINSIMAVTFTNKAALEICNRIKKIKILKNFERKEMWIGTFHSLSYRLLRIHYSDADLPKNFQILDRDDQLSLLISIIKEMNIDEKKISINKILSYINKRKDEGKRTYHIQCQSELMNLTLLKIYKKYEEICKNSGLVDFSELLLRTYELFLKKPYILKYYRKRFSNILIDEFQDTNGIQYQWIKILAGKKSNIVVVGDDDQSIYGWRGAKIENVQHFINDFKNTQIIRLEQNYRSTKNILNLANTLILNNNNRLTKKLWTNDIKGELIKIYCAKNEVDEADFLIYEINNWIEKGQFLKDCAILYRNNVQSRVVEEALIKNHIPYCIQGSMRFFEHQEIKYALAYLRIIFNKNDNLALEKIINVPARGIGLQTFNLIIQQSKQKNLTFWKTIKFLLISNILTKKAFVSLENFYKLINSLSQELINVPLYIQTKTVIKKSGLWCMYEKKKETSRIENLKELITATNQFNYEDKTMTPLQAFLAYTVLYSTENKTDQESLKLMTIHASKGLEFKKVLVIGLEEGTFPKKTYENNELEEERRLAYVAITRAMTQLTLSYSETKIIYGKKKFLEPSRFIKELPKAYLKPSPFKKNNIKYSKKENIFQYQKKQKFKKGQKVKHKVFGFGIVLQIDNNEEQSKIEILFHDNSRRWILTDYIYI
ncbi:UvrD-helicase domain-containing protein [Candidatus Tachikawaea gelatinosa]|uniref:DNA 3'-5' helicase n=1 Tax=Candidatus Tachikawaea gelatinosa TaxID=1410383 RepID=A0A090BWC8_9ENTR|nr:UvrD-helicase domain-containing protein [Candidatus Tachikawaea gelatinosa]BAP58381.1 DNA helicase II [Candidatus Tachikawaea gelatinosa]